MKGKTVIVTGANSGIGFETAAALAGMGAHVVMTARDPAKGEAAVREVRRRHPEADVALVRLDLARLHDVRSSASQILDTYPRIDVLVNNAGAMLSERSATGDGFETMFQVNHLAPFLLTNLLLDRLKGSAPARVVNVASDAHRFARMDRDDVEGARPGGGLPVYARTKLYNVLFTRELARRLEGTNTTANALHPGTIRTRLGREGDTSSLMELGIRFGGLFLRSPARGAETSVYLASSPDVEGRTGMYWVRKRPRKPSRAALDDEAAARLWDVSAQLVGL